MDKGRLHHIIAHLESIFHMSTDMILNSFFLYISGYGKKFEDFSLTFPRHKYFESLKNIKSEHFPCSRE